MCALSKISFVFLSGTTRSQASGDRLLVERRLVEEEDDSALVGAALSVTVWNQQAVWQSGWFCFWDATKNVILLHGERAEQESENIP